MSHDAWEAVPGEGGADEAHHAAEEEAASVWEGERQREEREAALHVALRIQLPKPPSSRPAEPTAEAAAAAAAAEAAAEAAAGGRAEEEDASHTQPQSEDDELAAEVLAERAAARARLEEAPPHLSVHVQLHGLRVPLRPHLLLLACELVLPAVLAIISRLQLDQEEVGGCPLAPPHASPDPHDMRSRFQEACPWPPMRLLTLPPVPSLSQPQPPPQA